MWTKRLFRWFGTKPQAPRRRTTVHTVSPEPAELPADEEIVRGCGWFDSSHELQHGLRVTEHADPGAVVNDVPLGWWVDWLARSDGPPPPRLKGVGARPRWARA